MIATLPLLQMWSDIKSKKGDCETSGDISVFSTAVWILKRSGVNGGDIFDRHVSVGNLNRTVRCGGDISLLIWHTTDKMKIRVT